MHALGKYITAGRDLDGNLTITLSIDDIEPAELEKLKDVELVIDIKKYSAHRSLNANRYFWVLCDMIAKALGSDKDTIYLLQLSKYGVFVDVQVSVNAFEDMKQKFRYVERVRDGLLADEDNEDYLIARCYFGSSQYTRKEMQDLITGTVNDAHDLGLETWSREEINRLIETWENK